MDAKNPTAAHPPVASLPIHPVTQPGPGTEQWAPNSNPSIAQGYQHQHTPPTSVQSIPPSAAPQPVSAYGPAPPPSLVPETYKPNSKAKTNNTKQPAPPSEPSRADTGKTAATKVRKPRKQGNASSGRSTLFWVNNDQQSVAEGTREETLKLIRSHVMSEHNRKKRLETSKRAKGKAWKNLAFQPVETGGAAGAQGQSVPAPVPAPAPAPVPLPSASEASRRSSGTTTASRKTSASTAQSGRGSVSSASNTSKSAFPHSLFPEPSFPEPQPILKEQEVVSVNAEYPIVKGAFENNYLAGTDSQALAVYHGGTPYNYVGQGSNDPFLSGHTPLSGRMHRHLQHFLFNLTRMAYPLQRRYGTKLQSHWTSLVALDPASLHACICVSATNTAISTGQFPLTDAKHASSPLIFDTFHHRGETIRLVNEGLSDPIKASGDPLIAAVSSLLTVEIATGDPDYLKIHLAGLRQMVGMRPSFADVAPDIRFQISWTDIRVACMALTRPIFPFVRYTRPINYTLTCPTTELESTASSLITLGQIPGMFGDAMKQIIYDLADLIWYAEWVNGAPLEHDFDDDAERYYNTEVLYIEYALHSDRYSPTGEMKGDSSIEGCVRLACLIFHNSTIWEFYPMTAAVFPKPIVALQGALETTIRAGCYHLCRDLLIWLLFIGACSNTIPSMRTFFVNELATAVRLQGVRSWQELRLLLFNFFYVDRCFLAPLRALWDEIQTVPVSV